MTMRRPLTLALFAFALLAVDVSLGATTSTAEGQSSVRESRARRARRARRERRAREAREEAERNAREAETAEATPETATEASPASEETPSLAESQSRRLDFDARVIRGETAGRGAIVLFERGGRAFAPLARVRRKFLLPTILAVFGEEPARPAEDER